ncbi:MAG: hypothetical protein ABTQ30_05305, partial [Rhizobiaceae bacterium]
APASPPAAGDPPAPAAGPYRPDGMPETMFGKDDRETIDKQHAALKGYRDRDASRDIPEAPEGYLSLDGVKNFQLEDGIKPYFDTLKTDPAALAMFAAAKEHGLGREAVLDVWQKGMKAMQEAGLLETPVDAAAERLKLLPDNAKDRPQAEQDAAIEARLTANETFVKNLMQAGPNGEAPRLDKAVGENALLMLMDTAEGNQFIEFLAAQMTGADRAQPNPGDGSGGNPNGRREQLKAQLAAPEMQPQHPKFNRAAHDALDAEYQKLFPEK